MPARKPKLLERVRLVMRARHMSPRTEQAYLGWIRRYVRYHGLRHPSELGERGVVAFVTHLAAAQHVARSTQIQALSALLLLYRDVLREPIGDVRSVIRSSAQARLPTVLSRGKFSVAARRARGRSDEARDLSHLAALIRDALAGGWV